MLLPRERVTQALLFGATFAATLYVFYRIGFRNRLRRWRSPAEREAGGEDAKENGGDAKENGGDANENGGDAKKKNSDYLKESGDGTKRAIGGCVGSGRQDTDRNPNPTPESILTDLKKAHEGSTSGCKDTTASTRAPEITPGSPGIDGPSDTESLTESVLAEVDDLLAADSPTPLPNILAATAPPREFREVSGEEVDALVNLTRRVLARDPTALSEIARQAAEQGVNVSATGDTAVDVPPMTWHGGPASVEGGGATPALKV